MAQVGAYKGNHNTWITIIGVVLMAVFLLLSFYLFGGIAGQGDDPLEAWYLTGGLLSFCLALFTGVEFIPWMERHLGK
ncbi:hypothetical protein NQ036_07265 [Brevibacterium sp. 91QC2O2]|uniref:hypothetical protein n=1 Tax=Brevibacterium sp. 91QC2O2 TaxID=2968458 RepID=UPI00211BD06C|nr:hypothetical protein [Brevibacterium sp. 91QC2O2]MCQ9368042.1 hypothetical protein [Brevibacterium sp. 91QC2O2]